MRLLFATFLFFGCLLAPAFADQAVELKLFPRDTSVTVQGLPLRPVAVNDTVKTYVLPSGRVYVSLSAQGFIPKTLHLNVQPGLGVVSEKLDPREAPLVAAAEVTTGKLPRSVTFLPDSKSVLVAVAGGKGAEVYTLPDLTPKAVLSPPAGSENGGFSDVLVLPQAGEIWLAQQSSTDLFVFDLASLAYKGTLPTNQNGTRIFQSTPDGQYVLVSNWDNASVTIIPTANRTALKDVYFSGSPRGLTLAPDGKSFYVCLFEGGKVYQVSLDGEKLAAWNLGDGLALRPAAAAGDRLYLGDMASGRLLVFKPGEGQTSGVLPLGPNPTSLALSADKKWLAATTRGRNNPADYTLPGPDYGQLFILNAKTGTVAASLWGRHQPTGLAFSPDGKWLVLTDYLDARLELYRFQP